MLHINAVMTVLVWNQMGSLISRKLSLPVCELLSLNSSLEVEASTQATVVDLFWFRLFLFLSNICNDSFLLYPRSVLESTNTMVIPTMQPLLIVIEGALDPTAELFRGPSG